MTDADPEGEDDNVCDGSEVMVMGEADDVLVAREVVAEGVDEDKGVVVTVDEADCVFVSTDVAVVEPVIVTVGEPVAEADTVAVPATTVAVGELVSDTVPETLADAVRVASEFVAVDEGDLEPVEQAENVAHEAVAEGVDVTEMVADTLGAADDVYVAETVTVNEKGENVAVPVGEDIALMDKVLVNVSLVVADTEEEPDDERVTAAFVEEIRGDEETVGV